MKVTNGASQAQWFSIFPRGARLGLRLLCCALLLPAIGRAITRVDVGVEAEGLSGPWAGTRASLSSTNAPVQAVCNTNGTATTTYGSTTSGAVASGAVAVGELHLMARGEANAQVFGTGLSVSAYGSASARVYWSDTFTLNGGTNLFGQPGVLTANLSLRGSLAVGSHVPGANASVQVSVSLSDSFGATGAFAGGMMFARGTNGILHTNSMSGSLVGPGLYSVQFPFHFGRTITIIGWAEVVAYAEATAVFDEGTGTDDGDADSDFEDTIVWAGINDVRVVGGPTVTNYTITSDSGYDYQLGTVTNAPVITRAQASPSGLALGWTDLGPRFYTVETTATLTPTIWAPAPGMAWPIHTNTVLLPLPSQSPAFFRVKVR